MRGIALECVSDLRTLGLIVEWMVTTFGQSSKDTWFIDYDYDLRNLMFNDEIATMFYLRWSHVLTL